MYRSLKDMMFQIRFTIKVNGVWTVNLTGKGVRKF